METQPLYQRNLIVLWIGNFFTGIGLSLVVPFLPLFIDTLGDFSRQELSFYCGIIIAAPFLMQAIVSPLWGRLADRKGRKVMLLRAALGMSLFMVATGFAPNVWFLLVARALFGVFSGFMSNSVALIAVQVPRSKSGKVMGVLNTSNISGQLLGPIFGGTVVSFIGYSNMFMITGSILFGVFITIMLLVKEEFTPVEKGNETSMKQVFAKINNMGIIYSMFLTTLMLRLSFSSINPILSLYVRDILPEGGNVEFWSGIVAAAPGLTTIISAPFLGALGDKIGSKKVLLLSLIVLFLALIPMAFVTEVWQLIALRLLIGVLTAALMPSVQSILVKSTPRDTMSRVFAYNQSAQSTGMVIGPLVGAAISGAFDIRYVFFAPAALILCNILIVVKVNRSK